MDFVTTILTGVSQPARQLDILILGLHYAPETTGNAPYTTSLAEGLARRGHTVRVISGHPHYPASRFHDGYGQWKREDLIEGVRLARLRHYVPAVGSSLGRLVSELSFGLRLVFSRWGSPDVILLVSPALFASAIAAVRAKFSRARTPFGIWVQDLYGLGVAETGKGGGIVERVITAIESATLRSSTGVAVIHERFRRHLKANLGVDEKTTVVIRNWTHIDTLTPDDRSLRTKFGWGQGEIIALHAGNMGVKQGLGNVVEAARIADENAYDIRFVLLGNGNQRDKLRIQAAGVSRIQFIDPLPSGLFEKALTSADILLVNELPGVAEMSVPSKLTSYFSTGRPVLAATDPDGTTAGEVSAAQAGIVVNAGSPQQLVDAALALGNSPEDGRAYGANGLRYREEVLGEAAAIDQYAEWLVRLAGARSRAVNASLPETQGGRP